MQTLIYIVILSPAPNITWVEKEACRPRKNSQVLLLCAFGHRYCFQSSPEDSHIHPGLKTLKESKKGRGQSIPSRETKVTGEKPELIMLSTGGRCNYRISATVTNKRIQFVCHLWEGLTATHWALQLCVL